MAGLVDYILLGAGAYYVSTKAKEKDKDFNKAVAAVTAGALTYYKGEDLYNEITAYFDGSATKEQKDRLFSTFALGTAGYVFGPEIGKRVSGNSTQNNNNSP